MYQSRGFLAFRGFGWQVQLFAVILRQGAAFLREPFGRIFSPMQLFPKGPICDAVILRIAWKAGSLCKVLSLEESNRSRGSMVCRMVKLSVTSLALLTRFRVNHFRLQAAETKDLESSSLPPRSMVEPQV